MAFNTASGVYYEQQVGYQPRDSGGNIEYPAPSYPRRRVAANSQIVDPKIGALQEIDGAWIHPLLVGSPAINAGITNATTGIINIDQRNVPRDSKLDNGAFELSSNTPYSIQSQQPNFIRMNGGAANDVLVGTSTYNYLVGGSGNNLLIGNSQQDTLVGGIGKDTLVGGMGSDRQSGATGRSWLSMIKSKGFLEVVT